MTYTIALELLPLLNEKYRKIASKVTKCGGQSSLEVSKPYYMEDENGSLYGVQVVDVEANCSYCVPGWTFVASLEWDDNAQANIIRSFGRDSVPTEYYTRIECDHCKRARARKHTILLKNEAGEYKQVGRACVKEYTGYDVNSYLSLLGSFQSLDEYLEKLTIQSCGNNISHDWKTEAILDLTCNLTRRYGYVGRKDINYDEYSYAPDNETTAQVVYHFYTARGGAISWERYVYETPTEEDKALRNKVIEFVQSLRDEDGDYQHNLKVLISNEFVESKNAGLVVSAVGFYLREKARAEREVAQSQSEFVGHEGDKIEITAKLHTVGSYETQFGTTYIYTFNVDGNEFVWKTGKAMRDDVEITIRGTIKQHKEFGGVKQTELTRCRTTVCSAV